MLSRASLKMNVTGVSSPLRLLKSRHPSQRRPKKKFRLPDGKAEPPDGGSVDDQSSESDTLEERGDAIGFKDEQGKHIDIVV
jgi:hypothetical protein